MRFSYTVVLYHTPTETEHLARRCPALPKYDDRATKTKGEFNKQQLSGRARTQYSGPKNKTKKTPLVQQPHGPKSYVCSEGSLSNERLGSTILKYWAGWLAGWLDEWRHVVQLHTC